MSAAPGAAPGRGGAPDAGGEDPEAFLARLRAFEGMASAPPSEGRDEVNQAMIRHWIDAMGDDNPVYTDDAAARANGFPGVVAPPTMLQAWIMRGYRSQPGGRFSSPSPDGEPPAAQDRLFAVLDGAGFTSVVATNCDQEYLRPLVLGDRLTVSSVIESVSPEKHTGLGDGHFITTRADYTDQHGETVATMRFRVLRFRPPGRPPAPAAPPADADQRPLRPRPAITHDNAFFFEGARQGLLLVQRCTACAMLRHPPRPACARCGSLEWDTVTASGRGTVYSYVVVHHPPVPGFDYPLPIAVVELDEGTRLVADLVGVDPGQVRVGMDVVVEMVAVDDELTLPMFGPAAGASATPAGRGAGPGRDA